MHLSRPHRRLSCSLVFLALLLVGRSSADAAERDPLDAELSALAEQVLTRVLRPTGTTTVSIGHFKGPETLKTDPSMELTRLLTAAFKSRKVEVREGSRYALSGEFFDALHRGTDRVTIAMIFSLHDTQRGGVEKFRRRVNGETAFFRLFGITADLPPGASPKDRNTAIGVAIEEPQTHLVGRSAEPTVRTKPERVAASPRSPYSVEVVTRSGSTWNTLTPTERNGQAWVPLKRGDVYAIRLVNNNKYDAAAKVHVDGLSVFAFSEFGTGRNLIIPAGDSILLRGWIKDQTSVAEFLVTGYEDSALKQLLGRDTSASGTITCTFAAAWEPGSPIPDDESPTRNYTGSKASVDENITIVRRSIGAVRSVVSVRYAKNDG